MTTASLNATPRSERGKGAARKLRQSGDIPAVIYGHGREPQPLALNAREVKKLLDTISAGSTVIELSVDGATARTLIREVQRHPVKGQILHIDFQELVAGERVNVSIPLRFIGTAEGVRNGGGILEETMHQIHLRVDPSAIPQYIQVDVTPLTIGHSLHIRELPLPDGVEILDDEDATVCVVTAPKAVVEEVPVAEVVEAVAEPELIRKPKGDEEGGEEA